MNKNRTFDELWENLKSKGEQNKEILDYAESIAAIIGEISSARKRKHLTQRDLAKKTGMKQSAIARIESMKVMPGIDTLMKIAYHLNMRLAFVENTIVVQKPTIYFVSTISDNNIYSSQEEILLYQDANQADMNINQYENSGKCSEVF